MQKKNHNILSTQSKILIAASSQAYCFGDRYKRLL